MDTELPQRRWRRRAWAALAVAGALAAAAYAGLGDLGSGLQGSLRVPAERLTISEARPGPFEDFIPLRGPALPETSVFLDAMEGGRVERKFVEDGARVEAGQAIAALANPALQLEVIRSEAEVAQQLNNLRSLELQVERSRNDNLRLLQEIHWHRQRIGAKAERDGQLAAQGFIAAAALQDTSDELQHHARRMAIVEDTLRAEEALQRTQAEQLRVMTRQLQANLALARANLASLTVRAPIGGQLSAFDVTVGQSLGRGQRIGQVDDLARFKLVALIDEYHLPRVAVGQAALAELAGQPHTLRVRRINPQVRQGQFEAELVFDGAAPAGLRRGQTLQARLQLAPTQPALLLPAGPFLADGGSGAVFVVAGSRAVRRNVSLGRRNLQVVEVLGGLQPGEKVVTSSYAEFADKTTLKIEP